MKVLFLMDSPEYLRFYDSAIEELAARGHAVAILVNSQREKKPVGLEGLQTYADRVSVLGVAPARTGLWADVAHDVRAVMDFVRFLHPRLAAAPALRARVKRKVLPRPYHWLDAIARLRPATVRRLERALIAGDDAIPDCAPIADFLRAQAPDVLLVSPLVAVASPQVDWIRTAGRLGIRTAVCVASWDNLTNKGLLRIEPDLLIVWNEAQKHEAQEYHDIPAGKIAVTGAQLFDRWFAKRVTREREEFCRRAGLPDRAPFVLFTGSSSFISESSAEVAFVRRWVQALRAAASPALRSINVLVRPHPYNFHRWADRPLADLPGVAVFPAQPYNPVNVANRNDFFDSLHHSAAVVGINTSAMIEASIAGRPVCSILAPEFAGTQEGTIHFHYLLPENGGCVRMAQTIEQHVEQLDQCLRDPLATRAEIDRFVASFIRPHGIERPATPIFADVVERLGRAPAPAPRPASAWRHLIRVPLLAGAAPVLALDWAARPKFAGLRKRLRGLAHRGRKRLARASQGLRSW